ncbi:DUF4158 domain-containing protein, partial [Streptomyces sp. NPDC008222]|uniref:DUF4158 domain-containing protein n=1 Tax=Streptomyces sp. NPDC008222 TaxID=3364820 RepID=UPI0036EB2D76
MAARVFADDELARLRGFPEINKEELIRFFTLTPADVGFIDPGRGRSPKDRLGLAVQLCTLPWLGFVPDDVSSAPVAAVARLSEYLQIPVGELRFYGERKQTRTGHLREVMRYLNWKPAKVLELKELDEFLHRRAVRLPAVLRSGVDAAVMAPVGDLQPRRKLGVEVVRAGEDTSG